MLKEIKKKETRVNELKELERQYYKCFTCPFSHWTGLKYFCPFSQCSKDSLKVR